MNTQGSYQKAPIGTNIRLEVERFTNDGGMASTSAEMVSNVAPLGFSLFLGGQFFSRNGINWN